MLNLQLQSFWGIWLWNTHLKSSPGGEEEECAFDFECLKDKFCEVWALVIPRLAWWSSKYCGVATGACATETYSNGCERLIIVYVCESKAATIANKVEHAWQRSFCNCAEMSCYCVGGTHYCLLRPCSDQTVHVWRAGRWHCSNIQSSCDINRAKIIQQHVCRL